ARRRKGPRTKWAPHNRTISLAFSPACSAFMEQPHAIVFELGRAGVQTRNTTSTGHPRTISYASALLTTPGAKIVQATLRRRRRETAKNSDSGKGARIGRTTAIGKPFGLSPRHL